MNEAQTRALRINPQLQTAEWKLSDRSQVRLEAPVRSYDPTPWNGYTDYSLSDSSGSVLVIVEAKRTARSPREGEERLLAALSKDALGPEGGVVDLAAVRRDAEQAAVRVVAVVVDLAKAETLDQMGEGAAAIEIANKYL